MRMSPCFPQHSAQPQYQLSELFCPKTFSFSLLCPLTFISYTFKHNIYYNLLHIFDSCLPNPCPPPLPLQVYKDFNDREHYSIQFWVTWACVDTAWSQYNQLLSWWLGCTLVIIAHTHYWSKVLKLTVKDTDFWWAGPPSATPLKPHQAKCQDPDGQKDLSLTSDTSTS